MSRVKIYWGRVGRMGGYDMGRRTRCSILGLLRRMRAREQAAERTIELVLASAASREFHDWLDCKRALIAEHIDDDLRHQHARDGIACPICGVAAGAECEYRGVHDPRWKPPPVRMFHGKVHTRRLMRFFEVGP